MFERYTEKARRVVFFARYEASQFGSPYIDSEHLLLGWFREERALAYRLLPGLNYDSVRHQVETQVEKHPETSTSVDLPLSKECSRILATAAEEAERFYHRHIGTEHLLLAMLSEPRSLAAQILEKHGVQLDQLRTQIATIPHPGESQRAPTLTPRYAVETVELHGIRWNTRLIREAIRQCRQHPWHWHKQPWTPRDIIIDRKTGRFSFDTKLAANPANFELVPAGWKKDYCIICRWELYESKDNPTHGEAFTNGRDWVCTECYEKFLAGPDYFGSAYSDIT
ncbi:MAG TPA: Clp protease N-terminal domain-containing protein [Terriglobales bacterium]|nr:Clp protease N-terminal domain-containing protein [Terriglobales bacterium]